MNFIAIAAMEQELNRPLNEEELGALTKASKRAWEIYGKISEWVFDKDACKTLRHHAHQQITKHETVVNTEESEAYLAGWGSGYNDDPPDCPFEENSREAIDWWKGYTDGDHES